ncbi:hypothetical protein BZA77DRAFT_303171 [Pyronema omphalodes]|nr:hypothetical protein BZA77DRAFT_303171 [Pyronema omphalodes]
MWDMGWGWYSSQLQVFFSFLSRCSWRKITRSQLYPVFVDVDVDEWNQFFTFFPVSPFSSYEKFVSSFLLFLFFLFLLLAYLKPGISRMVMRCTRELSFLFRFFHFWFFFSFFLLFGWMLGWMLDI